VSRDFLLLVFFINQFFCSEFFRKSRCTTGTNDTGGISTIFASVVDTCGKLATGVNDTDGEFATGVDKAGGKLPPVSTTPAVNFPPV
jgi:hypothetical protein